MKTTKKHFEIFKEECQKWLDKFELNNWDVFYKADSKKGTVAEIITDLDGYIASILFTPDWNDDMRPCNEDEIRLAAKHEVIHLLLGRVSSIGRTRWVNKDEMNEAEEELVKHHEHLEELVGERTVELQAEITERKKAEKALQEAHDKLEKRVEERTAALKTANEELQREITERKRVEEQLNISLEEKEILLKEIHHRAKNNMQIISSLLGLQSWYIKDKKVLEIFSEVQHRIKSMALIHEKLYKSEDLSRVKLSDYIKSLTANLFSMYRVGMGDVTLKQDIKDVYLDIKRAIPLGLIINELVLNSLKHAFPDAKKGEIVVKMYADRRKKHTLIVEDTGVGFPKGLDFCNTETLGMRLVRDLVKQLKGTIKLDRQGGSTFRITF